MQRLVGQKALVPTVRYSSTYRINNLAARKITSKDGTTTNLQHQRSYNTNTRSIIPIAWKMPSPSPGDIKAADEKFKYLAKTAEWKSFNATQIQMMYRMYREQLKRKMETIPIEELQAWADKYLMDGESPPKLRSPLKSLFATKQDWDKELTKIADKMLGGENEFKERMKRWEIEMFSDEKHIPIWSEQYATLHQISPEYYMKNAEFQVLMASMRALESKRDDPLFRDPYAEALVKNCGPTLSKYYDALEPFSNIHILDAAQLFTSRNALPTDVLSNYEKQFPRETDRDLARDYFAVRTKYFDNFLLERFSTPDSLYLDYHEKSFTKERQVVILGGGLDMRAFRLQFPPNTTVFEIDDEEIMEYKESMIQQNVWKPSCARRVAIATAPLSDVWEAMLLRSGFKDYIPTIWVAEGSCTYVHSQLVFRGSLLSSVGSWAAMEMMGDSSSFNSALLHHPGQIPFKTSQPKKDLSNRGFSLNGADEIGGPQANFGRLPGRTFFNKIFSHPPGYFVYGQKLPVDEASNKMKQLAAKQQIAEMQKGKVNHLTDRPEARMREEILEYDMYNLETNALTKQRAMQKSLKDIYVGTDVGKLLGSKNQPLIEKLQNEILQLEEESTERTERNANRNMKSDAEFVAERQEFLQKIYNGFRHIITETWIEFEEWRLEHKHTERLFMLKELEGMVAGKVAELFLHPDKYDEKPIEVLVREEKLKKDEEKYFKDVVFRNAWMHLSEGLTRLGVDTKENNESKAYRMLQNYMEPKEIPPPREKTKEQLKFEQLMEEDHQKQMEWQEEIVERQIMLHETLAEYAQNILDKRIQKADPRPIRKNRWIDASDRLLKEDIPLELQQKEKEVMLRLFKHGFTEEEKEIYQMRRDWKLRRQFAFQNATNSYQVSDVLNQINKEELEAKKKGKWRDDAWFLKIDQMVESWKDLGDPKAMPQVENNMALPQPYTWKRPKTRQLELIAEEERKKGQDISKYWYPKGAARGQYHMLQTDPRGLFAVPKIPVPGDLPKYMIWLYQRYRSPMPELPFRGMAKRVEMTRLLRNRASGWRKVKPRFRFERKFNRKRRTSRKLDPMTVEQKREIMVQRGDVIRAVPRSTAHKGRRVPTTHKMWGKFFSKMTWAVYDEWKQEYHAKLQEEKEFEAKKEAEGEKEGPKEGNEGKDSKKKAEH